MAPRLKDIAEKLGVSTSTVSLVLNNKPGVSEKTRQKVLKLAKELGYSTNLLSKPALKNQKNIRFIIYKKHGMVVSDTPFFSELIEGIDQKARDEGFNLIISYINEQEENQMEILRILKDNPPSGILLLATEMQREDLIPFKSLGLPLVVLDSNFSSEKIDTIIINNTEAAYEATQYLITNGHQDIGYLRSSFWINNFDERKVGFLRALSENGLKFNKKFVFHLEPTLDGAYRDMQNTLALQPPPLLPTAFFADNDIIAIGALRALKDNGYRIPEDISLIGFDNMPFCEITNPSLSTVNVYKRRMGIIALKRLIERIENELVESIKIEINTELVERKSVFKR